MNTPQYQSYQNLQRNLFNYPNAPFISNSHTRSVNLTKLFGAIFPSSFFVCSNRFEETILNSVSQSEITELVMKAGFKLLATSRPNDPKIRLLIYAKLVSPSISDTYRLSITINYVFIIVRSNISKNSYWFKNLLAFLGIFWNFNSLPWTEN